MVLIRGNLIIPKIWCCFNVNESFIKLFCLKIQALVAFILLGKLSYLPNNIFLHHEEIDIIRAITTQVPEIAKASKPAAIAAI